MASGPEQSDAPACSGVQDGGDASRADQTGPLTGLLASWSDGDDDAGRELIERIYPALRRVAARLLRRDSNLSLQVTELVSEAYLRLERIRGYTWKNHGHFLAVAATLVRQVLVDLARRKRSAKRGGGAVLAELQDGAILSQTPSAAEILAVHEALDSLASTDPLASRLVELRYFGGLSIDEAARVLELGRTKTVKVWTYARARLRYELTKAAPKESAQGS